MSELVSSVARASIHWPSVVRHYRLSKGLKQAALAQDLGVTQTMVSRWESGVAIPGERIQEDLFDLFWREQGAVSRTAWLNRVGRHPSVVAVVSATGRIDAASHGFLAALDCRRHELEGRYIHEAFDGDLVDVFDTLALSGFFEGRVASAETIDRIEFRAPDGSIRRFYSHGLHRPGFIPGPQVAWLISGAAVTRQVHDDVRARLGGQMLIRRAL